MSVEKRVTGSGAVRYDVRLRTPDGRPYKRTFRTKREAERFEASQLVDRARGTWIDPRHGQVTFAEWAAEWFQSAQHRWRPRTAEKHEMALRAHWTPRLGSLDLGAMTPRHVQAAVNDLATTHEPGSVRTYYGTLRACLRAAVDMEMIGRTPCRAINLPQLQPSERQLVTPEQLHRLADAVGPEWRCLILFGGVVGLRLGEVLALRVRDVDFSARSVSVARTLGERNGHLEFGEPKTAAGHRTLALPVELVDEIQAHVKLLGIGGDELLFADSFGGPLRRGNFRRRVFTPATEAIGLQGLTFHGLRHSAATLWVANGMDPRTVQHRLGHADPRLVLRLYAHALSDADQRAAAASSGIFWAGQLPRQRGPRGV